MAPAPKELPSLRGEHAALLAGTVARGELGEEQRAGSWRLRSAPSLPASVPSGLARPPASSPPLRPFPRHRHQLTSALCSRSAYEADRLLSLVPGYPKHLELCLSLVSPQ